MAEGHRMTAADLATSCWQTSTPACCATASPANATQLMEGEVDTLTGADLGWRAHTAARPNATAIGLVAGPPWPGELELAIQTADRVLLREQRRWTRRGVWVHDSQPSLSGLIVFQGWIGRRAMRGGPEGVTRGAG